MVSKKRGKRGKESQKTIAKPFSAEQKKKEKLKISPELQASLKEFILKLKKEHRLTDEQLSAFFSKELLEKVLAKEEAYSVPIAVFDNITLSPFEAIVKYLKEEAGLGFHKIAELLNRSDKTIWATYNNARQKKPERFFIKEPKILEQITEPARYFRLHNGQLLKSFDELLKAISLMDDDVFRKYVTKEKNDFCNWVRDVLDDPVMADRLSQATNVKQFLLIAKQQLKMKKLKKSFSALQIPLSIFRDRRLSILESLVKYLKDKQGLSYHQIAVLLNRNDRTIWTVYARAKKK